MVMRRKEVTNSFILYILNIIMSVLLTIIVLFIFQATISLYQKEFYSFDYLKNFIHLSFDDVEISLENLKNNEYQKLEDEPFFHMLYALHSNYDLKVSLYVYGDTLNGVPNYYKEDFFEIQNWLKLGLHSKNAQSSFSNLSLSQAREIYKKFEDNVLRITGTTNIIDRMPRLHGFTGSKKAVLGLNNLGEGIIGLLTADDNRNSYYLDRRTNNFIYSCANNYFDKENGLYFIKTDLRLDWFNDNYNIKYNYDKPKSKNLKEYLSLKLDTKLKKCLVVFAHEWDCYNGQSIYAEKYNYLKDLCEFSNENNLSFEFPEDMIKKD